jgi:tetratricopeptide (TPR) repeat protein
VTRAELEEQRQFLLDSLRDLEREREAGELAEDDYEALREDYTARAADVLRALEAEAPRSPDPEFLGAPEAIERPPAHQEPKRRRRLAAAAVALGVVAVAVASVFVLAEDRRPGQPVTGSIPDTPAGKLALAHQLEGQGEALEALKLYDAVLKEDPANVEAMTYRGWLLKLAGLTDQAQESLDKAVALDASYPDARFFRGMLLYQDRKDPAAAVPEFEAFLASNPPPGTAEGVREVLERARRDAAPPPSG